MRKKRSIPWFLIGALLILFIVAAFLFTRPRQNEASPAMPAPSLPQPGTTLSTPTLLPELPAQLYDFLLNELLSFPENCQLGFEIPWEHDENNPITDEKQIMEILRALGDLEECLFARQDGWLHYYALQNGQRTEEEVLVHLTDGGRYVDLRYFLFYDQGQYTAELYYDGRTPEDQWCNVSDEAIRQVVQVKRNCKTTEVYHLLTGNGKVDGYVGIFASNFSLFKKQPAVPGYYEPKAWFTQENGGSFFVIDIKYDMSDVQGGQDPSDKPFTDAVRRHFIDLNSGRLTRYVEETGYKDGSLIVVAEDGFLLFYPELPDDIAAAIKLLD